MKNILPILILFVFTGCEFNTEVSRRSGDNDNDYVEEPLSEPVEEYTQALETVNLFVEAMKSYDYLKAYELCDQNIQKQLNEVEFEKLLKKDEPITGKFKEFKKLQWSFNFKSNEKVELVRLTKIIKFEKLTMNYTFVFIKNGNYSHISGFSFKEKTELL